MTRSQALRAEGRRAGDVGARRLPPRSRSDGLGVRARARRGMRDRAGAARARRRGRHRQRRDPRRRGRARRRRLGPHAGELRGRPPRGRARGVELEWVEADAEALPFADGEFDVVTSSFGAIFAPDHQAVADELLRVCRPGGTIGMVNFTPEGLARRVLRTLRAATRRRRRRSASRRSSGAARSTSASSSATACRVARADAQVVRGAEPRRPARVRRVLQGDLRAVDRALRAPRRRAGARWRRSTAEFLDFAARANAGSAGRPGRVPLRVPARRRAEALGASAFADTAEMDNRCQTACQRRARDVPETSLTPAGTNSRLSRAFEA